MPILSNGKVAHHYSRSLRAEIAPFCPHLTSFYPVSPSMRPGLAGTGTRSAGRRPGLGLKSPAEGRDRPGLGTGVPGRRPGPGTGSPAEGRDSSPKSGTVCGLGWGGGSAPAQLAAAAGEGAPIILLPPPAPWKRCQLAQDENAQSERADGQCNGKGYAVFMKESCMNWLKQRLQGERACNSEQLSLLDFCAAT